MSRQAQWHADKAVRLHSPPVETALLLKVEALLGLGKHAEALNEIRSLTIHGDPMATEVLTVRAQALYLSGATPACTEASLCCIWTCYCHSLRTSHSQSLGVSCGRQACRAIVCIE